MSFAGTRTALRLYMEKSFVEEQPSVARLLRDYVSKWPASRSQLRFTASVEKGDDFRVLLGATEKKNELAKRATATPETSEKKEKPETSEKKEKNRLDGRVLWDVDDLWKHVSTQRS